jgi:type IV pilus assembly protein PilY1
MMSILLPMTAPRRTLLAAMILLTAFGARAASIAPNDPPNLGSVPPDLGSAVNPNIIVTFDDSGSMANTYMGDNTPYNNGSWNGPWACANTIDPRVTASTNPISRPMNGVFYNPNVTYAPPLKEDGTSFPNADVNLLAVWEDGIAINRPSGAVTPAAAGYHNNPQGSAGANSAAVTNLMGIYTAQVMNTKSCVTSSGSPTGCHASQAKSSGCPSNITTGLPANTTYVAGSCTQVAGSCSAGKCYWNYQWTITTPSTDNRWECGNVTWTSGVGPPQIQNPFDGTVADPDTGAMPNGGPVYWRFKASADSLLTTNSTTGDFTSAALTALYTAGNWEAVSVPSSQYQNLANWYAYYRYRNLMARSSMSRVFGVIGSPTSTNIRVLWQNINNATYGGGNSSVTGLNGKMIDALQDNFTDPYGSGVAYRQAFFNWIYQVGASGNTPTRTAAIRAGNYLCGNSLNGNCNGSSVASNHSDTNPWWNEASAGLSGTQTYELACRQNFHMMMTDGLYNSPSITVSGSNATATSSSASLPGSPPQPAADPSSYAPATGISPATIFNHPGWTTDSDSGSSYSDIAFYYWANNLRTDFVTNYPNDTVPQYYPDQTTGVTAAPATVSASDPGATPEVFWNPNNDPANWPHLVQYAVTLGAFGNLSYSNDVDCSLDSGFGVGNDDMCKLRKGATNSSGSAGWPRPNGSGSGVAANIDDLWHAAINSRGSFFVATDPQTLISHLTEVLTSITSRVGSSVAEAVSSSILNNGSFAYVGGYNSSGWSGYLLKQQLDPNTGAPLAMTPAAWDAGCILTGGLCADANGGAVGLAANPLPASRVIFTSVGSPGSLTASPFEWGSLPSGGTEATAISLDPTTTHPDTATMQITNGSIVNGTADPNGLYRVNYIRGDHTYESQATPTSTPVTFRPRSSTLGAIVNSQAVYEKAPSSGLLDIYPVGSPEQVAGAAGNTYEKYVKTYLNRNPLVYVGVNDGMLHAFDGGTGVEKWAYVPNALFNNGQLGQLTNTTSGLVSTVDDTPIIQDVFLTSDSNWHTMLVGGLRLGGRGIYALDVTKTDSITDETQNPFMWEFTSQQDADLGYSYATTNFARIRCNVAPCSGTGSPGGTWVVLVTSGYFPQCLPQSSTTCTYNTYSATDSAAGATSKASGPTYLWVLNATDGSLIAKIPTKSGVTTYGLGTPSVVDFGLDQISDVVVAGDLAGNVWRFDLTDPNPANWSSKVDVLFQTYTSTAACSTSNTSGIGCEPISVMPVAFPDTVDGGVIYVFGSGEYLGPSDNTTTSVYTPQHYFGVRDYGTHYTASDGGSSYPFHESDLNTRIMTQSGTDRSLPYAYSATVAHPRGWQIPLNLPNSSGERVVATPAPLYSAGVAILTSLIPGQNADPCNPGRTGAVVALNASNGGPPMPSPTGGSTAVVGTTVSNPPAAGGVSVISVLGGGTIVLPGMGAGAGSSPPQFSGLTPVWRRTSWSQLLNQL